MDSQIREIADSAGEVQRVRLVVRGVVQGVGFRPYVYRLAVGLGLAGWVQNTSEGVCIELEGPGQRIAAFCKALDEEKPPHASLRQVEVTRVPVQGQRGFQVRGSLAGAQNTAAMAVDVATCRECLRELFDPANRRYRYPFITCALCGPRYSIIESLPYDRARTTMKLFPFCEACAREFHDPQDRRFHAQAIACKVCGPHVEFWDEHGLCVAREDEALRAAAEYIKSGKIVAVKGLGGFQLFVDARQQHAVQQLRRRKMRPEKPFAVMFPDISSVAAVCCATPLEQELLTSSAAPIVLLRRRKDVPVWIAESVAPGNPFLGVMLPYTPLHHLLMIELGFPVVATSGNRSEEPLCIDEEEACRRLQGIADAYLVHNRPIARHVDDSVVCVVLDRPLVLRSARGYAPLLIELSDDGTPVLATGGQLKNTVALRVRNSVFVSQHIGDLDSELTFRTFHKVIDDFVTCYQTKPRAVACDLHPDYTSTRFAEELGLPTIHVQHHYAHILACMVDNGLSPPVLGVAWDGTGYGQNGEMWGGEFLRIDEHGYERLAHFRPFLLPGGEQAIREPRRAALGLLYEVLGRNLDEWLDLPPLQDFSPEELVILLNMLERRVRCISTTSVGRLFDGMAALIGLKQTVTFEGQAAMQLEFLLEELTPDEEAEHHFYHIGVHENILDWRLLLEEVVKDLRAGVSIRRIALRFHRALVEALIMVARSAAQTRVLLSGGCFQNRFLLETAVRRLQQEGFEAFWHRNLPPNDGGISVGQILAASQVLQGGQSCKASELSVTSGHS